MSLSHIHLDMHCSRMHTLHANGDIHVRYMFWCDHYLTISSFLLILIMFAMLYMQLTGRPCSSPSSSKLVN